MSSDYSVLLGTEEEKENPINLQESIAFLSSLFHSPTPFVPNHCKFRGLLLHEITHSDTFILTRISLVE